MTNKERYKQAFSVLHTSDQFSVEVENMSRLNKKHNMKVAAAVLAGCILLAGGKCWRYSENGSGMVTRRPDDCKHDGFRRWHIYHRVSG